MTYWFIIPGFFMFLCTMKVLHFKTMLYNKRNHTNIGIIDYMKRIESLWLLFPIIDRTSYFKDEQEMAKQANKFIIMFWTTALLTFLILFIVVKTFYKI
jgi:hypothetical protein